MFDKKVRNEYKRRLIGGVTDIITKVSHYEVHGHRKFFKLRSGKLALFELTTWLPFEDAGVRYTEPEEARWMVLRYDDGKKDVYDMTLKEFKKFRKELKSNNDIA